MHLPIIPVSTLSQEFPVRQRINMLHPVQENSANHDLLLQMIEESDVPSIQITHWTAIVHGPLRMHTQPVVRNLRSVSLSRLGEKFFEYAQQEPVTVQLCNGTHIPDIVLKGRLRIRGYYNLAFQQEQTHAWFCCRYYNTVANDPSVPFFSRIAA